MGEGVWQTPDQRVNFTLVPGPSGNDLYVSFADRTDVIVVRNWSNDRRVGITLPVTITQPSAFALALRSAHQNCRPAHLREPNAYRYGSFMADNA